MVDSDEERLFFAQNERRDLNPDSGSLPHDGAIPLDGRASKIGGRVRRKAQNTGGPNDDVLELRNTLQTGITNITITTLQCPEESASVAFHDYTYRVRDKVILDGISRSFRAGRLTAIMGPSGSGKTSLIETLTGSNLGASKDSVTTKSLTLNGRPCTRDDIAAISGFVPQEDYFLPTMKVREAVEMSATLRLPQSVSKEERKLRAEEALRMLNLTKCAESFIGGIFSGGISGGEKRRVSICRELIANPPILFLDEPTTGLGSFTAFTVIEKLKLLARQGRTVVITIHQPNSEIFKLFDDLALLVDGRVIYWGSARNCLKYFDHMGFRCPMYANPADFLFMEVLRPYDIDFYDTEKNPLKAEERVLLLGEIWKNSKNNAKIALQSEATEGTRHPNTLPIITKAPFLRQFSHLYWDYLITGLRSPLSVPLRLVFATYTGLIIGLTYTTVRSSNFQEQIRGKAGALSYLMTFSFIGGYSGIILGMYNNRNVFMREYRSHYYDVTPAYFAKVCFAVPLDMRCGMTISFIAYYMVGLNPAFSCLCLYPSWLD